MGITSLRFKCIQCGKCCIDNTTIVNVTYNDILRIKNGLNLSIDELLEVLGFYMFEQKVSSQEIQKMVIPPVETEKGLAFVGLKKNEEGACFFFDSESKKCRIYSLRPNFCRTFPFSFDIISHNTKSGAAKISVFYTEKGKQYCPGIGDDAPLINKEKWLQLGKIVLVDLDKNNKYIKKWNSVVQKDKSYASVKTFLLNIFKLKQ